MTNGSIARTDRQTDTDGQVQTDSNRHTSYRRDKRETCKKRARETDRDTERARRKYREQTELQRYLIVQIDKRHNIHLDLIMHIALQTKSL